MPCATTRAAGIRPMMITGDHPLTALHIARELGIAINDKVLTGQELAKDDRRGAQGRSSQICRSLPVSRRNTS